MRTESNFQEDICPSFSVTLVPQFYGALYAIATSQMLDYAQGGQRLHD
jgi:hypothetical protein